MAIALGERLHDGLSVLTAGEGPPLVLIPGLGHGADLSAGAPRSARLSAQALATATGRTVHLIHRPFTMPAGTTIGEVAGWYGGALRERFDGPVDVVGVSAGGVTALQLTLDHADVVRRLVVSVAASRIGERGRRELLASTELDGRPWRSAWAGARLAAAGPTRIAVFLVFGLGGLRSGGRPRAAGEVAMIEAVQDWDVTTRLGEITVPTLVVGGTRDALVPVELISATARGIPDAQLVLLPGRGHLTAALDSRSGRAMRQFLAA